MFNCPEFHSDGNVYLSNWYFSKLEKQLKWIGQTLKFDKTNAYLISIRLWSFYLEYQNQLGFIEKMNVPKAFFCILKTDIALSLQNLGIISEYEVPQK